MLLHILHHTPRRRVCHHAFILYHTRRSCNLSVDCDVLQGYSKLYCNNDYFCLQYIKQILLLVSVGFIASWEDFDTSFLLSASNRYCKYCKPAGKSYYTWPRSYMTLIEFKLS
jgi:hypothetical protein